MAPRAAVRTLLGTDPELISYDFAVSRLFSSDSADTLTRDKRWGVIRWLDRAKSFGAVGSRLVEVWLYQPREMGRDYGVLDVAIVRIEELMTQAEQVPGADGWTMSGATLEMSSADLTDETINALVKFVRFRVAGRPVAAP